MLRLMDWCGQNPCELESIAETEAGVAVTMFTESDEHTRRWWPAEFRLAHRVTFSSELSLELLCTNTGTTSLCFEEALHTYDRVADVARVLTVWIPYVFWTTPIPTTERCSVLTW